MSSFYNNYAHHHPAPGNAPTAAASHHSGRGRRAPRLSQNAHKQFRGPRKDEEAAVVTNFRQRFEAGRSFDLDDDLEFCPNLLTETDMVSIHSSSSDRSSQASGSPESSPQSHQVAPDSSFTLNSNAIPYISPYQTQSTPLKIHQPAATRVRSAIPIINPSTGLSMASPPSSVSPARMQQQHLRQQGRW
ncbi:hypothetical protein PZA11_000354 [Diplocarpon coronariae]|uniref:Uncharacterized protein n=1 Tax=Diplocarpon coronariae TaxID=2795749 RepID=A0A218Z3A1_9HELO|nr:hypothetical protein JHW43_002553 [Diplocarpon mali]OWP02013.1 hypothetical protein B2J93_1485 [Marssonina coronariae]